MSQEKESVKQAAKKVGEGLKTDKGEQIKQMAGKIASEGTIPKDMMGLSDAMVEGIYGQAYRLYNTGKFKDAAQLFRMLIMFNPTEGKYAMGLAACYHMSKEYEGAVGTYTLCSMIEPDNPIPLFHSSDCYIQMGDIPSAMIALETAIRRASGKPEFVVLLDRAKMTIESLKKQMAQPKQK